MRGAPGAVAAARDRSRRRPLRARRRRRRARSRRGRAAARARPGLVVAEAKHRGDERTPLTIAAHVDEQLTACEGRQLTESRQGMDQLQLDPGSIVEQSPQPLAVAVAQVERPLAVTVTVVVTHPLLASPMDGVKLADQRYVVGAVVAVADLPRVESAPGERAVDPAPARPRAHQPRHQPRPVAGRPQRKLDRQRSLPGRASGRRSAPAESAPRLGHPSLPGEPEAGAARPEDRPRPRPRSRSQRRACSRIRPDTCTPRSRT